MKCQRNELEAVLSSMKEGVLAVDNEGVIINVNQMAATLLGANDAGQLRGKVVQEVVRKAGLLEFVETSLASTAPVEDSIRIFADEDRWLHVHGTMLQDARNQKIGTLIVLHDVTRLRRLEDVRRDFVANVSHELRTPITSIKGFVETLIDGAYEDRENARRFLEIIARQADRLNAIIEDLLMLSWLEKGAEAQPGRLEPGPVLEVLRAAIDMCEKMAGEKSVTIEVQCEPKSDGAHERPPAGTGGGEPGRQRAQVQRAGVARARQRGPGGRVRRDSRSGLGLRHRTKAPVAPVRAVLSRGQGAQSRAGWDRTRAGHRQTHRPGARGHRGRGQQGGRRQHVFRSSSVGGSTRTCCRGRRRRRVRNHGRLNRRALRSRSLPRPARTLA